MLCDNDDDVNLKSNEGENCEPEPVHEYDDESLGGDVSEEETALSNSVADEFSNDASEAIDSFHLEQVLEDMEKFGSELEEPPVPFDYESFMLSSKDTSIMKDSLFSMNKNSVVDNVLSNIQSAEIFIRILWLKIFSWTRNNIKENISDTVLSWAMLKEVTSKVWLIGKDKQIRLYFTYVLDCAHDGSLLGEAEICVISDIAYKILECILDTVANAVRRNICAFASKEFHVKDLYG